MVMTVSCRESIRLTLEIIRAGSVSGFLEVLKKLKYSNYISIFYAAHNNSAGHLIFFLGPIGVQVTMNLVLFIFTTLHITRVKSEISKMQSNDDCQKKQRFIADKAM